MISGTEQVVRIPKVGVEGVRVPLTIDREGREVIGLVDAYVALDPADRGVHLSRLTSSLSEVREYKLPGGFYDFLKRTTALVGTHDLFVRVMWETLFIQKSPMSGEESYLPVTCTYEGLLSAGDAQFFQGLVIPYTSSCPCSKQISDAGAHNQRSWAHVKLLTSGQFINQRELLDGILDLVPAPIYNVVKRVDEKWVTEEAYKNSQFVEDVARGIAQYMVDKQIGQGWRVKVIHEESIHTHNVVAIMRGGRKFVA